MSLMQNLFRGLIVGLQWIFSNQCNESSITLSDCPSFWWTGPKKKSIRISCYPSLVRYSLPCVPCFLWIICQPKCLIFKQVIQSLWVINIKINSELYIIKQFHTYFSVNMTLQNKMILIFYFFKVTSWADSNCSANIVLSVSVWRGNICPLILVQCDLFFPLY